MRSRPGDFVSLPLPSGGYGYGRVLNKLMAFYDLRTDELVDVNQVAKSKVLFITAIHISAIRGDRWHIIGNRPLEVQEEIKFFRKHPSKQGFLIYVSKPEASNAYEEYEASTEECRGLEPLLVWEPDQIEQRIDDHFQNRENIHLTHYLRQLLTTRGID